MDQFNNALMFNQQSLYGSQPPTVTAVAAQGQKTEHIKRPLNQFMVWAQEERKNIKTQIPVAAVSQELASRWKKMSAEERAPWKAKADRLKMEHYRKYPDYKFAPKRKHKKTLIPTVTPKKPQNSLPSIQTLVAGSSSSQNSGPTMNLLTPFVYNAQNPNPELMKMSNVMGMVQQQLWMQSQGYQFYMQQQGGPQMATTSTMSLNQNPAPNYFQSFSSLHDRFAPLNSDEMSSVGGSSGFSTSPSSTSSSRATPAAKDPNVFEISDLN